MTDDLKRLAEADLLKKVLIGVKRGDVVVAEAITTIAALRAKVEAAEARVTELEAALNVTMYELSHDLPGDSRAVPDWFVACAAVQSKLPDDGKVAQILATYTTTQEQDDG